MKDVILFLEGYRYDIIHWNTMLEQYKQMHVINKVVVLDYIYKLLKDKINVLDEFKKIDLDVPIVKTNDFGHVHGNSIIPIGVNIEINPLDETIKIIDDYLN